MRFYIAVEAPHRWARVSRGGKVKQHGTAASLTEAPVNVRSDEVFAVIPGAAFITSKVEIPGRNRARIQKALPFALEEQLSEDVDAFHFFMLDWKPGQAVVAGIVSRQQVEQWRLTFDQAGVPIHGMVADYQLLPVHPRTELTIAKGHDQSVSVLGKDGLGATMDESIIGLWWQDRAGQVNAAGVNDREMATALLASGQADIKEWTIGEDFTSWLNYRQKSAPVPNLLPSTLESGGKKKLLPGLRLATVILILAGLAKLAIDGYDYSVLKVQGRFLGNEMNRLFTSTFPEESRVVNARVQFRQKIMALQQGGSGTNEFQSLLVLVTPAVKASRAELQEINYRENGLEILCSVNKFADLDTLKSQLEQRGATVALLSSGSLGNKVTGRYKITRLGAS